MKTLAMAALRHQVVCFLRWAVRDSTLAPCASCSFGRVPTVPDDAPQSSLVVWRPR